MAFSSNAVVSVIKCGAKYLAFEPYVGYSWVSNVASAYLYFGNERIVMEYHSMMMNSKEPEHVVPYRDFLLKTKGTIQVVPVIMKDMSDAGI